MGQRWREREREEEVGDSNKGRFVILGAAVEREKTRLEKVKTSRNVAERATDGRRDKTSQR